MFFIVHIKSSLILGKSFPHEYIVLSSVKLQQISDFSTKKKISLMDLLNNSGPNIEKKELLKLYIAQRAICSDIALSLEIGFCWLPNI